MKAQYLSGDLGAYDFRSNYPPAANAMVQLLSSAEVAMRRVDGDYVRPVPAPPPPPPAPQPLLAEGSTGADVERLQRLLIAQGQNIEVDGSFGALTRQALEAFQRARGLQVDGIAGPMSWAALEGTEPRPVASGPGLIDGVQSDAL